MAEIGRFFDGPAYGAQAHAEFYTNFLSTGFFWGLDVTANDTMQITVASGSAFLEGHEYRNTESLNLEHNIADSTNDRIDRVVIRLDNTPEAERPLRAMIRTGMPESDPEPPELIRNDAVYEISLAQVLVEAGKSYIEQHQITDERGDIDLCGRVSQPAVLTDQIHSVDVKLPIQRASEYIRGHSVFNMGGATTRDILDLWLDSVGFDPSSVGRNLSDIRAYVETNAQSVDTGMQTITIFDWSQQYDYRIYGKFTRTSNSSLSAPTDWGSWHEEVLIYEQGENSNGKYIRYTDGTQRCWGIPFSLTTTDPIGALYRDNETWTFPVSFVNTSDLIVVGDVRSFDRWISMSSLTTTSVSINAVGVYDSDNAWDVYVQATGRWR